MLDAEGPEHTGNIPGRVMKWSKPSVRIRETEKKNAAEPGCACARSLEQVENAWQLVYERYVHKKLIDENPFRLHTVPMAVGPHVCVVCGPGEAGEHEARSTLTLIADNPAGTPLDSVYGEQMDALRRQGRRLIEVGLLADRRRRASRSAAALFSMMRWAAYYTLHSDSTDIVVGVHPHHAKFYARCFGFDKFAPPARYPLVRDNPVVPLRLPLREALAEDVLPRGLAYVRDNPLSADVFSQRFRFEPGQMRGSLIESFLKVCQGRIRKPLAADEQVPQPSVAASLLDEVLPGLPDPGLAF